MAGPTVMALAIVGTCVLGARRYEAPPGTVRLSLILGASLLLAHAIVALKDPANVVSLLPVLSACVAAPLGMQLGAAEPRPCSKGAQFSS